MPFLGVQPTDTFAAVAKQTITGDGSTTYTLTHSVASANDLAVFVNNVRQEPTTAYSASGTSITFTEAIASTDSCYVVYIARTFQTLSPPDNSVNADQISYPLTNFSSTGIDDNATSTALNIEANGDIKALSGNIVIGTSGKGIDFSATSDGSGSKSSELLDDYEEGSFSPTFVASGTNFSSISYSIQSGHYTKIGNLVSLGVRISVSALTTGSASGYLMVGGLPFSSAGNPYCSVYVGYSSNFSTLYPTGGEVGRGQVRAYLYAPDKSSYTESVVPSNLTSSSHLYMGLIYYTA
jgi:hypothetical protein